MQTNERKTKSSDMTFSPINLTAKTPFAIVPISRESESDDLNDAVIGSAVAALLQELEKQ